MALGKRNRGAQVEPPAEQVSDKNRPGLGRHQPLGHLQPWGKGGEVQVDRHGDQTVRFDDADHVRMRDGRHQDLVPWCQVERVEKQVKPGPDRAARNAISGRRPSADQPVAQAVRVPSPDAGRQGIEELARADVESVALGANGLMEGMRPDAAFFDMSTNSVALRGIVCRDRAVEL